MAAKFYTTAEVAKMLKCTEAGVRYRAYNGKLTYIQKSQRKMLFPAGQFAKKENKEMRKYGAKRSIPTRTRKVSRLSR